MKVFAGILAVTTYIAFVGLVAAAVITSHMTATEKLAQGAFFVLTLVALPAAALAFCLIERDGR